MNSFIKKSLGLAVIAAISSHAVAQNQTQASDQDSIVEEVLVTGIRNALKNALDQKRASDSIKEVIQAEDIGKLPDQNLAEVLENITGIQIVREAGVGSKVQIRGTDSNRVEINGVGTLSGGNDRTGISFNDIPAALIAAVEVTKSPDAKTIEGSVGGTINLRTQRGLGLSERLLAGRIQIENSDLADEQSPRLSATFGDNWETDFGDIGFVISGSYAEQSVASFDPRLDRDREVLPDSGRTSAEDFPFLRVQFLDQQLTAFDYETKNITTSLEWAPNDELKFYADLTVNDQERAQKSARALVSGTGGTSVVDATTNTEFRNINLGSLEGANGTQILGGVEVVEQGILGVGVNDQGGIDPNLRIGSNTSSRLTESQVFAAGVEWERDNLKLMAEVSKSSADTTNPGLNTTLDFINPNGPQPMQDASVDNGVPIIFDASGRTLQFGIAQGLPESPSTSELLDPANYALRSIGNVRDITENEETAFRMDGAYDLSDSNPFFTSVKTGFRWNSNSSLNSDNNTSTAFSNAETQFIRPTGDQFADILVAGPDNFDAADGRQLFISDYLIVNPNLAFSNPAAVSSTIDGAITATNTQSGTDYPPLGEPTENLSSFFDITEDTTAIYLQGDYSFDAGIPVRGNVGFRWISTEIESTGNNILNGELQTVTPPKSKYDFFLPRINVVAEATDSLLFRAGYSKDIRRLPFNTLTTSVSFGGGADSPATLGDPSIEPENFTSFDLSAEYYFNDTSFASIGYFHKKRSNVLGRVRIDPAETPGADGQIERDITDPCEGGGIFNPNADRNVFSSTQGTGICVPLSLPVNLDGDISQRGVEVALQYDLGNFEDTLGWASGFGFIANYTYQEADSFDGDPFNGNGDGNALNNLLGRTDVDGLTPAVSDDPVTQKRTNINLSKNSYNFTMFYDKNDISLRARYTWRSSFITGETVSFGLPRIVDDRAQLNLSANYNINDQYTVGIEGINLLREDRTQWCVNEGALLCSQGLTDRRIVVGLTAKF